jgi:hypothetical protein
MLSRVLASMRVCKNVVVSGNKKTCSRILHERLLWFDSEFNDFINNHRVHYKYPTFLFLFLEEQLESSHPIAQ